MIYEIKLKPKVEKFLDKLPQDVALRIIKKLKQLKENPFRYLEHYEGEGYKFRIGDYRVIFDVDNKANITILIILRVKHRKEVYL